ncbi:MAG: carboxypeptidase regulatory-like domain-containing protein [Candidatus Viridilinea halotolerans]|uniref:Carboxypeptidase regulatory-like domain-containing protein n=1 Tax=Candidatus Viridilinea halotolerans TaxID=2491704 RepID=A0A426TTV4_9CHLR|nr:MAG: carboxypeptidase regulatory-like domain-containing protein [Candidatus Viridilinea halotolerans]
MPREHSPALEEFAQGLPPPPPDPAKARRRMRILMSLMTLVLGVLVVINVAQSRTFTLLRGQGTITGQVLDARGMPVQAELIIERTELVVNTEANGTFVIAAVPAGHQRLVVARDGVGVEYPILVIAGASVDVGPVQAETTAVPVRP